jgi:hypothetical protein
MMATNETKTHTTVVNTPTLNYSLGFDCFCLFSNQTSIHLLVAFVGVKELSFFFHNNQALTLKMKCKRK